MVRRTLGASLLNQDMDQGLTAGKVGVKGMNEGPWSGSTCHHQGRHLGRKWEPLLSIVVFMELEGKYESHPRGSD